jgi:hypothetical protein
MKKDAQKFLPFQEYFELTILHEGLSKHEANTMEEAYIDMHDATSKRGYHWCFGKPFGCRRWWARLRKKI